MLARHRWQMMWKQNTASRTVSDKAGRCPRAFLIEPAFTLTAVWLEKHKDIPKALDLLSKSYAFIHNRYYVYMRHTAQCCACPMPLGKELTGKETGGMGVAEVCIVGLVHDRTVRWLHLSAADRMVHSNTGV